VLLALLPARRRFPHPDRKPVVAAGGAALMSGPHRRGSPFDLIARKVFDRRGIAASRPLAALTEYSAHDSWSELAHPPDP